MRGRSIQWLEEHVTYQGSECLTWSFSGDGRGYGTLVHEGVQHKAHRLMCVLTQGSPPTPQHHAAHSCGRGHLGCVNPRHLSWKTAKENQADAVAHGTVRFGGNRPRSKLTDEDVVAIRALKGIKTQEEIAKIYGVTWRQIGKIHRGKSGVLNPAKLAFRPHEDGYLRSHVASTKDLRQAAKALNRTYGSVHGRVYRLGLLPT